MRVLVIKVLVEGDGGDGVRSDGVKEEVGTPMTDLSSSGAHLDPHFLFNSITANTISSIAFDEHFNYQDPQLLQLLHLMNEGSVIVSSFYSQVRLKTLRWARNQGG